MRYPELTANDMVVLACVARFSRDAWVTTTRTVGGISLRTGIPSYEVRRSLNRRLITRQLVERSEHREHTVDNPSRKRRTPQFIYGITPEGVTMLQDMSKDLRW